MYKHISTLSLAAMMLLTQAQAQTATTPVATTNATNKSGITMVKPSHVIKNESQTLRRMQSGSSLTAEQMLKFKHKKHVAPLLQNSTITLQQQQPARHMAPRRAADNAALWESFEDYDPETGSEWLPDGWTRQRTSADMDIDDAWIVGESDYVDAADGYCVAGISYSSKTKDEWLITPEVTVSDDEVLSFYVYFSPMYMFIMDDDHVDWDTNEFINKERAAAMDVRIQVDGGEWTVIKRLFRRL